MDVFHAGIWTGLKSPGLPQVWKRSEAELETGGSHGTVQQYASYLQMERVKRGGLLPRWVVHRHGKTQLPQEGVSLSITRRAAPLLKSIGSSTRVNQ